MAPKGSHLLGAFMFLFLVVPHPLGVNCRTLKPAEFRFSSLLQVLEGSGKGQTLKGLHQVKEYLNGFGYYQMEENINLTDEFDDQLESALKTYQENYGLKVTGKIDSDTIKAMKTPRCGVPDIVSTGSGDETARRSHKKMKFHLTSDYAFFNGKPRWSSYELTYTFRSSVQVVGLQELRSVCRSAFQRWSAVSPFEFQEAPQGTQANIVIGFYSYDHGDGLPFDGPGNILAHAFPPKDGRFHIDADENWSTSNNPGKFQVDLESLAVHEIGHLLGLAHSQDPNAIMHQGLPPGTLRRELTQDDIDGIRALYPVSQISISRAECLVL